MKSALLRDVYAQRLFFANGVSRLGHDSIRRMVLTYSSAVFPCMDVVASDGNPILDNLGLATLSSTGIGYLLGGTLGFNPLVNYK